MDNSYRVYASEDYIDELGFVSYNEQTLTDEQKQQARANIGAIDAGSLYYKQPPIYRIDTSNSAMLKIYINIRDLENGGFYYFNTDKQVPDNTATVHQLYYIVVCDDGTELSLYARTGMAGYQLGEPIKIINQLDTSTNVWNGYLYRLDLNQYYRVSGTIDTSANLTKEIHYNANYLHTNTNYEYTPTSDYHPATKKYVDDSVGAVSTLVGDTSVSEQINDALSGSAVLYGEAQTLTDEQKQQAQDNIGFSEEEALSLAMELNLVSPVAADDGSIYTDENGAMYSL